MTTTKFEASTNMAVSWSKGGGNTTTDVLVLQWEAVSDRCYDLRHLNTQPAPL